MIHLLISEMQHVLYLNLVIINNVELIERHLYRVSILPINLASRVRLNYARVVFGSG